MYEFLKERWNYCKDAEGTFTINAIEPEMLIARTFGEEGAIPEAEDEAISELPEMYKALQEVIPILESCVESEGDDFDEEVFYIRSILSRIDGEEAQS